LSSRHVDCNQHLGSNTQAIARWSVKTTNGKLYVEEADSCFFYHGIGFP
jgi:hypothetical protein